LSRFEVHSHTEYSNIRTLDSINKIPKLIQKAKDNGLCGIAITDHEILGGHIIANKLAKDLNEEGFKLALGNEIYLVDERENNRKYYHFILIAKDEIGYEQIKRLSSNAWYYSYKERGATRVPTLKKELFAIVNKNPGHLIATSACLGGELSTMVLNLTKVEELDDTENINRIKKDIYTFLTDMKNVFKDDFYIECAPGRSNEQIRVNERMISIAKSFDIKMVIGTDAHYLNEEDRFIHETYLRSKEDEREVDSFYKYAYLQTEDEIKKNLSKTSLENLYSILVKNSEEIYEKITFFNLNKKQRIPIAPLANYFNKEEIKINEEKYPHYSQLFKSKDNQKRAWAYETYKGLVEKKLLTDEYLKQLDNEADIILTIDEEIKLDVSLFAYFNTLKSYIDLFWECGSIVGPGRGSATGFLSNYLLGITQLDPIQWNLKSWRFLNKSRFELPDVDIDLDPTIRPLIFEKIREKRGELGLLQVCTYGTEGTKSAILTACRAYRSEDYPDGIDVDEAQYLSSLVPIERGITWTVNEIINGNVEKDRKPVKEFVKKLKEYPGLETIISGIEGLINKRGEHASGVILYDNHIFETAALMRSPSGTLVTQYDLHDAEWAGDIKYDFLVTETTTKLRICLEELKRHKLVYGKNIRELYNIYIHPQNIDIKDPKIWRAIQEGEVLDVFQFNSGVGLAIAKKLKPSSPLELTSCNAIMRLMSEKGQESMQDRYYRIQNNGILEFEQEMIKKKLNDKQRLKMHSYCDETFGCVPTQEQMMEMLMDIANFTLAEANDARKIVAKKQMNRIPELKNSVFDKMDDKRFAQYFWDIAIRPSLGYAFSTNHSLPYSFVAIQTLKLATSFNPIFWNTACLIVNSGSAVDYSNEQLVDIYEEEDEDCTYIDLPDRSGKIKKTSSSDYAKIAKAIGAINSNGIKISLVDINKSERLFSPDPENNKIFYGLKGLVKVGDDVIDTIIANRPYNSFWDFMNKVNISKTAMVSLIKSGAFDRFGDRKKIMGYYLYISSDLKKSLTLTNFPTLIKNDLVPRELQREKSIYEFNRYLKSKCKNPNGEENYILDNRAYEFYQKYHDMNNLIYQMPNWTIGFKVWDKIYQSEMNPVREYLKENKDEILFNLNFGAFQESWKKNAEGTLSKWEMDSLCFYYHEHELKNLDKERYGIDNWNDLDEIPDVDYTIERKGITIPIYNIHTIAGTCIAKDKVKSTIHLLTMDGVITVKFRKEHFSLFDKQLSEKVDGKKKVTDKSWFSRGSMLIIKGIRRGDDFVVKKYNHTIGHQLYKITSINKYGEIEVIGERE